MLHTPSPNFNDRRDGKHPSILVMHYTGMQSAEAAVARMCDPLSAVSAHFVVEEGGAVRMLVDPSKRAWHAGQSFWRGERDINSVSIGIEIVNPGHEFGYVPFPEVQMEAVCNLSLDLMKEHGILSGHVVAHSDIAPARKADPGELFGWKNLAMAGVGVWPQPDEMDWSAAQKIVHDDTELRRAFLRFGYDPECELMDIVMAFQRHYCPQRVLDGNGAVMDGESVARLMALLRIGQG